MNASPDLPPQSIIQVSLRGASAKEITRDALLQKVSRERELRNYAKRAASAALFIQSMEALQGHKDDFPAASAGVGDSGESLCWCDDSKLDFKQFVETISVLYHPYLNSASEGPQQENRFYEAVLYNPTGKPEIFWAQDITIVTSLAMRVLVMLTDLKGWKGITDDNHLDADLAVKDLIQFLGEVPGALDVNHAAKQFFVYLLTIPWLVQHLPPVLLPALKHKSILFPCFQTLLILKEKVLMEMLEFVKSEILVSFKAIPPVGWALTNSICLATGNENESFNQGLEYALYVRVVITLAEALLACLDNIGWVKKKKKALQIDVESSTQPVDTVRHEGEATDESIIMSYMDQFRPVCQQWHLKNLLASIDRDANNKAATVISNDLACLGKLELCDVALFYSNLLRIFSVLSPIRGPLSVLNMLAFTPGFLVRLWGVLEDSFFSEDKNNSDNHTSESSKHKAFEKMQKHVSKDGANKWVNVLHKFTGRSQAATDCIDSIGSHSEPSRVNDDSSDVWDTEPMRHGPQGVPKDMFAMLHLFCATYSHLLLVLDDIEFYEKQIPFKIEQQRRIASMLNTLVYNGLSHVSGHHNRPLMDCAVRCLHLLYERDCRHPFCPPALWLSPARKSRPPIAVAARTHEVLATNLRSDDSSASLSVGSVVTIVPHVFPFEERASPGAAVKLCLGDLLVVGSNPETASLHMQGVEMFREFIKMDKASRKMAGEISEPGSRAIEIVIRRGHIVEDGFRQLNSLGSRLKSSIHVSFVSECGLLEAGLDYGGLSKEFLTDISKAAFSPEYGLFSQNSTSDRLLIPTASARYLENGLQMIEFLGRVVGKALYEGILLDYSFSHVFVQKLLGRYSFLDELSTLDPELYRNLMYVKGRGLDFGFLHWRALRLARICALSEPWAFPCGPSRAKPDLRAERDLALSLASPVERELRAEPDLFTCSFMQNYDGDVKELSLDFTVTEESLGKRYVVELKSGGKDISVTNENKMQYIHAMADYKLNQQILPFSNAFYRGLTDLISPAWLKLFNASEFNQVIKGFEPKERCMLLKFVTSCSRAPLLGFKYLQPPFTIHKVACDVPLWATIGGQDVDRLPSASTCYNTLKLPTYKRPGTLRAKLLYAISSNAGFELS
ncbi:E3 ubiquitin-protein ligase UPL7 [Glycine soja]|nr:E3 ubiquitin-protein ligase UPL7 [Glycine soja]